MTKLKSMTDYVLEQEEQLIKTSPVNFLDFFDKTTNYARFLSMPLELKMFVPCDENGNVFKRPFIPFDSEDAEKFYTSSEEMNILSNLFQKAKSEVIFTYTNLVKLDDNVNYRIFYKDLCIYTSIGSLNKTIEDLVKYNLALTPQAKEKYKF